MNWETARRWLEIMAKNVFDPNQPAYIVVLQRVEELEAAVREIRGRALASRGRDVGKVEARARLDRIAEVARAALRRGVEP